MILRGEALVSTFTINFTLSGDEGRWKVAVDATACCHWKKKQPKSVSATSGHDLCRLCGLLQTLS
jgi:hypothetical protein